MAVAGTTEGAQDGRPSDCREDSYMYMAYGPSYYRLNDYQMTDYLRRTSNRKDSLGIIIFSDRSDSIVDECKPCPNNLRGSFVYNCHNLYGINGRTDNSAYIYRNDELPVVKATREAVREALEADHPNSNDCYLAISDGFALDSHVERRSAVYFAWVPFVERTVNFENGDSDILRYDEYKLPVKVFFNYDDAVAHVLNLLEDLKSAREKFLNVQRAQADRLATARAKLSF